MVSSCILSHIYSLDTKSEPMLPFESQCRIDREKLTMKMKAVDIIKVGTKRTKSGSVET